MTDSCVFCGLLDDAGRAEWIWRGDAASALLPLPSNSLAPGHTLVISNEHAVGVQDISPHGLQAVTQLVQRIAQNMARALGATGVNILNASGPHSAQSVPHLHFHVVPRWKDDGLDTWPAGRSTHEPDHCWLDSLRAEFANLTRK